MLPVPFKHLRTEMMNGRFERIGLIHRTDLSKKLRYRRGHSVAHTVRDGDIGTLFLIANLVSSSLIEDVSTILPRYSPIAAYKGTHWGPGALALP